MFGRRPDATLVRDLGTMRRFQPFVSPRRNDAIFYLTQDMEVEAALEFLEALEHNPGDPVAVGFLALHPLRPS